MTSYIPVQRSTHQDAGYSPVSIFSVAAEMATVPLQKEELPYVIQNMCVAFQKVKNGSEENYELVGMQSLTPGKNLFLLPDGRWLAGYQPAFYRAQPFALLPNNDQNNQLQLCINSDCIKPEPADDDLRFFQDDKGLTPRLQQVVKFLTDLLRSRQVTQRLCKALREANLIVPWPISYKEPDDSGKVHEVNLDGFYHIDSVALESLAAEQLAALNVSGALSLAYGQILSEARLTDLAKLQTAQRKLQQQKAGSSTPELDLNTVFGDQDDVFSF